MITILHFDTAMNFKYYEGGLWSRVILISILFRKVSIIIIIINEVYLLKSFRTPVSITLVVWTWTPV